MDGWKSVIGGSPIRTPRTPDQDTLGTGRNAAEQGRGLPSSADVSAPDAGTPPDQDTQGAGRNPTEQGRGDLLNVFNCFG
ncbi:MAG: hypothetical protein SGI92_25330 [Bryobacteraceae bacterium]|nr:hypothetical protein [Bryobacteraceae bacterium]